MIFVTVAVVVAAIVALAFMRFQVVKMQGIVQRAELIGERRSASYNGYAEALEKHVSEVEERVRGTETGQSYHDGYREALQEHVREAEERLKIYEAGHNYHIGGSATSHDGRRYILYECQCGTSVLAPEGFIKLGHEVSMLQSEEAQLPRRGRVNA